LRSLILSSAGSRNVTVAPDGTVIFFLDIMPLFRW
jgi:hypothetical protein